MVIRTRIDPIDRDIALMLSEDLSPAAQSQALARYARNQFDEAQAINERALGRKPKHETFVDGSKTELVEKVRPDGTVVFEFELMDDLLGYIDLLLVTHSPVKHGNYRRAHIILADGYEYDPSGDPPNASEFVYLNVEPYARKIERGQSKQAPDGVYQVVAALAARRFGNVAKIKFSYRAFLNGKIHSISRTGPLQVKRNKSGQFVKGSHTRAGSARERQLRQPAIIVTFN